MTLELGNDYLSGFLFMKEQLQAGVKVHLEPDDKILASMPTDEEWIFLQEVNSMFKLIGVYHSLFKTTGVNLHRGEYDLVNLRGHLQKHLQAITEKECERGAIVNSGLKHAMDCINAVLFHFDMAFKLDPTWREVSVMGSLLHPFYRGRTLLSVGEMKEFLKDLVSNHPSTKETPIKLPPFKDPMSNYSQRELDDMELAERRLLQYTADELREKYELKLKNEAAKAPLQCELDRYFAMPQPANHADVLDWWRKNSDTLPLLASFAKEYLSIPFATSVPFPEVPVGNRWTHSRKNVYTGNASYADLIFIQETTLDAKELGNRWDYGPLAKVNFIYFILSVTFTSL